ncbi:MAG: AMP-binding protein, partial [Sulfurimonas sp.]
MLYPYENLENFTLKAFLDRSVSLYPQKDALSLVSKQPLKYRELDEKVKSMVELLKANGISKGDKVALLSENMPNWAVAYLAITYFGAVVVPILVDFNPADVNHIIKHSEAKAVFVSEKYLQTLEDIQNTDLKFVIEVDSLKLLDEFTN